jgi:hypothetical protein
MLFLMEIEFIILHHMRDTKEMVTYDQWSYVTISLGQFAPSLSAAFPKIFD